MDFHSLVVKARSCRRFDQGKPLSSTDLEWLIDCARQTPCARNAQVLRYTLVSSPEKCAEVFPHTRWAGALKDWDGPAEGERPTAYIAIMLPKGANSLVHNDVGIAAQTIQLAATSRDWGCCILASFERTACSMIFGTPDEMETALLLALGVAKEDRRVASMPADGNFNYWRDANGVHYVPKRTVEELIIKKL